MDAAKFERICLRNGFSTLQPIPTSQGRVLIAERYFNYHVEYPAPHWQTLWAFDRDKVEVAQKLFIPFGTSSSRQRRHAAATAAKQWVEDNQTVGRYKN